MKTVVILIVCMALSWLVLFWLSSVVIEPDYTEYCEMVESDDLYTLTKEQQQSIEHVCKNNIIIK